MGFPNVNSTGARFVIPTCLQESTELSQYVGGLQVGEIIFTTNWHGVSNVFPRVENLETF